MATNKIQYEFMKGKSKKSENPGILVIDNKFKFFFTKKMGEDRLYYQCCHKKNLKCTASAVLFQSMDGGWILSSWTEEGGHNHEHDRGDVIAKKMKEDMRKKIKDKPEMFPDEAHKDVIIDYEHELDPKVFDEALEHLNAKENIARVLRRERSKAYGPTPANRDDFEPAKFISELKGGKKIILLDSNKDLGPNWEMEIEELKSNISNPENFWENVESFGDERIQQNLEVNDALDALNPCELCRTTEHYCKKCKKKVCNFCSVGDQENDLVRTHISCLEVIIENSGADTNKRTEGTEKNKLPKRILCFTSNLLLQQFSRQKCSVDGTFKVIPTLWTQLFILMIKVNGAFVSVCYCWLPDKKMESYMICFHMIKQCLAQRNLPFNITKVTSDFELAILKALVAVWKVQLRGCNFHFGQCLWRFVQEHGMATVYKENENFNDFVKSCDGLSDVPLNALLDTINKIKANDWDFEPESEEEKFKEKFLKYIDDTWVNGAIPPHGKFLF